MLIQTVFDHKDKLKMIKHLLLALTEPGIQITMDAEFFNYVYHIP